jgi:hypothetical protein
MGARFSRQRGRCIVVRLRRRTTTVDKPSTPEPVTHPLERTLIRQDPTLHRPTIPVRGTLKHIGNGQCGCCRPNTCQPGFLGSRRRRGGGGFGTLMLLIVHEKCALLCIGCSHDEQAGRWECSRFGSAAAAASNTISGNGGQLQQALGKLWIQKRVSTCRSGEWKEHLSLVQNLLEGHTENQQGPMSGRDSNIHFNLHAVLSLTFIPWEIPKKDWTRACAVLSECNDWSLR